MLIMQQADGGLTLSEILSDIPHDAGALVVYVLIAAFVGFIWYGTRRPHDPDRGASRGGTAR